MNTTKISKSDGEYRVRLFINGVYQAGADYFTDDKVDANTTAQIMRRDGKESDKDCPVARDEQKDYDQEQGVS